MSQKKTVRTPVFAKALKRKLIKTLDIDKSYICKETHRALWRAKTLII